MSIIFSGGSACAALTDNLIAFWPLDEASGNALDATGNGRTLTETSGTIDAATGLMYATARDLERGDSECFRAADAGGGGWNRHGNIDFTYAGWLRLESLTGFESIVTKESSSGSGDDREVAIYYNHSATRFEFVVTSNGSSATTVAATNFGAPSTGAWYFLVAYHDATNDVIGIQINNGAANETAFSGGTHVGTSAFSLGSSGATTPNNPYDGLLQAWGRWNRLLSEAERTWLYNGGAGRTYAEIAAGMGNPAAAAYYYQQHSAVERDRQRIYAASGLALSRQPSAINQSWGLAP